MKRHNRAFLTVGLPGIVLSALFAVVLYGCGSNTTTTVAPDFLDRLNSMGVDKYIGLEPTLETTQTIDGSTWEVYSYDPSSPARCFNGSPYIVSLHRGDPQKVLLYLEGGGACWDYTTCYSEKLAKSGANPAIPMGMLDPTNPANPFKNYSIIYASYCDASVWSGDNDVDFTGATETTYFHGLANLSAAVTLMKQDYINPSTIVVAGSSAGGYGTFMGYFVTRTQYPFTTLNVINDSGVGLFNPQESSLFQHILATWNLSRIIPSDCPKCSQQMSYLADWALDNDPDVNFGFFSYYNDMVIGSVFLQMSTADFKSLLLSVTGAIHAAHPTHFERFFVDGDIHTVLELPAYYTMQVSGTTISQWTADMITDTADWKDTLQ